jgi:hypothetical protein
MPTDVGPVEQFIANRGWCQDRIEARLPTWEWRRICLLVISLDDTNTGRLPEFVVPTLEKLLVLTLVGALGCIEKSSYMSIL